jgi:hypothetical protein
MNIPAMRRIVIVLLALGWVAIPKARADEQRITCPLEIPRVAVRIAVPPRGWTPFVPFEYRPGVPLSGAGVMYGPPSIMATSKPSSGTRATATWSNIRPRPDGVWMACYYGDADREDMILSRRLDARTTECTVTYSKDSHKRRNVDIRCH